MDVVAREINDIIRNLDSNEAAEWLIANYPIDGRFPGHAFEAIAHNSWKAADQIKLSEHYLQGLPFNHLSWYESLLKVMSLERFVVAINAHTPIDEQDRSHIKYFLKGLLLNHPMYPKHKTLVNDCLSRLS